MQSFKFVLDETTDVSRFWAAFIIEARKYSSTVTVTIGGKTVSGTKIVQIMALGTGEATINIEGSDESEVYEALRYFTEGYGIETYDEQPENTPTYTNYKLTVPNGVTASGDNVTSNGMNSYSCREGTKVTLNIGKNAAIGNVNGISDVAADENGKISFNISNNVTITDENLFYAVNLPSGVEIGDTS